jgi:hypothetical protein
MDEQNVKPREAPQILTKPLPQILDEIEASIRMADEAAKSARKSAEDARKAGEKAASDATRAANQAIANVQQTAKNAMELAELLNLAIREAVAAIEKRLSEKP